MAQAILDVVLKISDDNNRFWINSGDTFYCYKAFPDATVSEMGYVTSLEEANQWLANKEIPLYT